MDILQQGVAALIRSAISGEAQALPESLDLTAVQKLARKHQIENFIYYGGVNCGIDGTLPVMKELFVSTCQCVYVDRRQRQQLDKLLSAFRAQQIHHMPLKGVLLKQLYPRPDMRVMSDADILIREEQYPRIRELLKELDFTFRYETDHEIVWKHPGLNLELHKKLVPERSREFYGYFGTGWKMAVPVADEPYRYEFTREDNILFLFTHFAKHYTGSGIGIRHMVDLWVYERCNPDLDRAYILRELGKMGLDKFYENVMYTVQVWFEGAAPTQVSDFITCFIFDSGVYGAHAQGILAFAARDSRNRGGRNRGRGGKLLRSVFPGRKELQPEYPVLKKAPVLLPFIWIVRGVRILLLDRKKIGRKLHDIEETTDEHVKAYEQALAFVGLDFQPKESL